MKHTAIMMMSRIHDLTQKWLRTELSLAGLTGVAPSHGDVLALLFMQGEATMRELAAFAHRTKPTMTVLVDKLEEMGLVRRMKAVDDARGVVVSLTPSGESLRGVFDSISQRLVGSVYVPLTRSEGAELEWLLAKVLSGLEKSSETTK